MRRPDTHKYTEIIPILERAAVHVGLIQALPKRVDLAWKKPGGAIIWSNMEYRGYVALAEALGISAQALSNLRARSGGGPGLAQAIRLAQRWNDWAENLYPEVIIDYSIKRDKMILGIKGKEIEINLMEEGTILPEQEKKKRGRPRKHPLAEHTKLKKAAEEKQEEEYAGSQYVEESRKQIAMMDALEDTALREKAYQEAAEESDRIGETNETFARDVRREQFYTVALAARVKELLTVT